MQTEIIVAIIAATAGWLGLILTKEQKVSEFRQKWIDALREDLAILVAAVQYLLTQSKNENVVDKEEIKELLHAIQRIKYRLNPDDEEGLIEYIDELASIVNVKEINNLQTLPLEDLMQSINETGHAILKKEWERVKTGEPWFYYSKYALILISIIFLITTCLTI